MEDKTENHSYEIRPRFRVQSAENLEQIKTRIINGLAAKNAPCKGKSIDGHFTLYLPKEEQHYWSPQLSLSLEDNEEGCLVRGMFGPRPEVWSMFVLFYSVIGLATLIISVVGYAQMMLKTSAAILWLVPVLLVVFVTLYLVSYSGQKMGRDQMKTLHDFLVDSTGLEF
ncbi:MAG: hypothetical protein OCD76_00045 [Reichenbachiella sp.]